MAEGNPRQWGPYQQRRGPALSSKDTLSRTQDERDRNGEKDGESTLKSECGGV